MSDSHPKLLGVGGAHIDRRGQVFAPFVPGASNPGRMREDIGGGTFNALRNAAQRQVRCALFSVRGGDGAGEAVGAAAEAAGIEDLSATFLDRTTASYTALIDHTGDVVAALADMEIYETGFPRQMRRAKLREEVEKADAVLCDANLPAAALGHLARIALEKPLFAIAISPAKVVRLRSILPQLALACLNKREADALASAGSNALADRIAALREAGLKSALLSEGGEPLLGYDGDGAFQIASPAVEQMVDATGAGDALAGATIAALMRGLPLREAARHGVAAARLTLLSDRSVASLDPAPFEQALETVSRATLV